LQVVRDEKVAIAARPSCRTRQSCRRHPEIP
jgi:hypothetical protein